MKIACLALALASMLRLAPLPAPALLAQSSGAGASDVGFYVRAHAPENQMDARKSYFDLRVAPEQKQTLLVDVVNESAEEMQVEVRVVSASTNRNGVIDYTTPDVRDETLAVAFSEIARVEEAKLTLPAGSTATARIAVEMPKERYDGVVLGGIVFTKLLPEEPSRPDGSSSAGSEPSGARIQNQYSYVIGAVLSETDAAVAPDFEVVAVKPELVAGRAVPVHYIRNKNAAIVKQMELQMTIYRDGEMQPVAQVERKGLDMAPNSVMPFAPEMASAELPPGRYTSATELRLGNQSWTFQNEFVVEGGEVRQLNALVVEKKDPLPLWAVVVILALVAAVFALAAYVIRRRQKEAAEGEAPSGKHTWKSG